MSFEREEGLKNIHLVLEVLARDGKEALHVQESLTIVRNHSR